MDHFLEPEEFLDYFDENNIATETAGEIWENCVTLSIESIFPIIRDLVLLNIGFGILISSSIISENVFHFLSGSLGIYLISKLESTHGKILLLFYFISAYLTLQIYCQLQQRTKLRLDTSIKIVFIAALTLCEHYLVDRHVWIEIRGIIMVLAMKLFSLMTEIENNKRICTLQYFGYTCCGANVLFGPWISYTEYKQLHMNPKKKNIFWLVGIIRAVLLCLVFLTISNCWTMYFIPDHYNRWLQAYREALSVRTSHYFISYVAEAAMISSGFSNLQTDSECWTFTIVNPLHIEFPTSLSKVVTSWNSPMHLFLKKYIYRPLIPYGQFVSIFATFLVSSFLHGFELKVSVVLICLGIFSYLQIIHRQVISRYFDICLNIKPCRNCRHTYKRNNILVRLMLVGYSLETVLHLVFLGILMDSSTDKIGIYDKWENLFFVSHIIMTFNILLLL